VVDEAGLTKSGLIQRYWIEIKWYKRNL
jgi:hypothetical protein